MGTIRKLKSIDETKKFEHAEEKIIKPVLSVDKATYKNNPKNRGKWILER